MKRMVEWGEQKDAPAPPVLVCHQRESFYPVGAPLEKVPE
jgi:hypothetical protein